MEEFNKIYKEIIDEINEMEKIKERNLRIDQVLDIE